MRCPFCRFPDSKVIDSREVEDGQVIRRRRSCPECSRRFTTVEESVLAVVKRSGVTEPFSRAKVVVGVRRACQGRPVDEDALALLSQQVEEAIRATGCAEISSHEVGLEILGPLRNLDEVAYLRFASVYRSFDSVDDFEVEIERLRQEREQRELGAESAGTGDQEVVATAALDAAYVSHPEVATLEPVTREPATREPATREAAPLAAPNLQDAELDSGLPDGQSTGHPLVHALSSAPAGGNDSR